MAQHAILRFEKHKGNPARPLGIAGVLVFQTKSTAQSGRYQHKEADGKETGQLQDADGQKESSKG
ncbi:hypothetical protein E1963_14525 [Extibacter muris]|uniref:Uncharacterized protein n=1 Tax=Extibacter muris TaxID=1796622 RepID=A0A4R4FB72_9FIRM|nr:hypothetical protein E1963_14525 [Extibacter muris]